MKLSGTYAFKAQGEKVFAALVDPAILQKWESGRLRGVRRLRVIFPGQKRAHSGYSETTHCFGSLSHFRNDFGCWNFL